MDDGTFKETVNNWNEKNKSSNYKIVNRSIYSLILFSIVGLLLILGALVYMISLDKFKSDISNTCADIPACPSCPNLPNIPSCPQHVCENKCDIPNKIFVIVNGSLGINST